MTIEMVMVTAVGGVVDFMEEAGWNAIAAVVVDICVLRLVMMVGGVVRHGGAQDIYNKSEKS